MSKWISDAPKLLRPLLTNLFICYILLDVINNV